MRWQTKLVCGVCRRPLDYLDGSADSGAVHLDEYGTFVHRDDDSSMRDTCRGVAVTDIRRASG